MEDVFTYSDSPDGTYRCIVEGDTQSVWAYLHDVSNETVLGAFPVCSVSELLTYEQFKESYRGEGAPPLVREFTSQEAVIPEIKNERIEIEWDDSNGCVLVKIDCKPVSKLGYKDSRGSSVFITREGFRGSPWSNEKLCEPGSSYNSD